MAGRTVTVAALDYGRRFAVLDTGEIAPFESIMGPDGEDTDEIEGALGAVARLPTGDWIVIDFDDFAIRALH